jgi:hypothetical protein
VCLLLSQFVKAQETELNCNSNFGEALYYLKRATKSKKDSLKAIEYLKPCLKIGNDKAQLLMGRLFAAKKDDSGNKKAFKLFKKSAKQGNAIAAVDLGIMYKYGLGTNLNYNKARKWFKKAALLGNDKATYSLGYLYLKGFGDIDQNYSKAIKWFKKSEYPMAKYWLGVCYYYGYGVEQNIQKANELLGTNFEDTAPNDSSATSDDLISDLSEQSDTNSEVTTTSENINEANLLGKWEGFLLKYDWSGNQIEQKHALSIEFKYDSIKNTPIYSINLENQELTGDFIQIGNEVHFEGAKIKIPHATFNETIPNELEYHLLSSDLLIKNLSGIDYLVGDLENYIRLWDESGSPLKFVLKKKETFTNNNEVLSDEVLQALAGQEENFIKLYPNPFQNDLIISYNLDTTSFVEVKITDINGTYSSVIEKRKEQKTGKHRYFFNGSNLEEGIYIVTVIVNNQKKTRIIVKK